MPHSFVTFLLLLLSPSRGTLLRAGPRGFSSPWGLAAPSPHLPLCRMALAGCPAPRPCALGPAGTRGCSVSWGEVHTHPTTGGLSAPAHGSRAQHGPSPGNVGCACPPIMALATRFPKSHAPVLADFDTLQLCFILDKAITDTLYSLPRLVS